MERGLGLFHLSWNGLQWAEGRGRRTVNDKRRKIHSRTKMWKLALISPAARHGADARLLCLHLLFANAVHVNNSECNCVLKNISQSGIWRQQEFSIKLGAVSEQPEVPVPALWELHMCGCVGPARLPAMATQRRQGATGCAQDSWWHWSFWKLVFFLFFIASSLYLASSFSSSSSDVCQKKILQPLTG